MAAEVIKVYFLREKDDDWEYPYTFEKNSFVIEDSILPCIDRGDELLKFYKTDVRGLSYDRYLKESTAFPKNKECYIYVQKAGSELQTEVFVNLIFPI